MKLNLQAIPRVKTISKKDFIEHYFKPQKPVVIECILEDSPAYHKWSLDYMRSVAGDIKVPLYNDRQVDRKDGFNQPYDNMKMSEYIDLLKREPTKLRIFLWNILEELPNLAKDFYFPDLGLRLMKRFPMLFFGGSGSHTFMHYDIDMANIFHIHFEGKKRCILFDQQQSNYLYKIPYSSIVREDIDFSNPDLIEWPALKKAKGWVCELHHGEVLYIPEGYWHDMQYITPGFSKSYRAIARHPKRIGKAIYNIFVIRALDDFMRRIRGQKWIDWKNQKAIINTNKKGLQ